MNETAPAPQANQGAPEARIDARLKVTGVALYAADMPLNDPLFGVLATSTVARGHVTTLHLEEARAVPGVVEIISYGDIDGLRKPKFGSSYTSLGPLHEPKIWHTDKSLRLSSALPSKLPRRAPRRSAATTKFSNRRRLLTPR